MTTRHSIILASQVDRVRAARFVAVAPPGTVCEFRTSPPRTLAQNKRMWAMLGDISRQCEIGGRKFPPAAWKSIFMQAFGVEVSEFLPTLDGGGFFPLGTRTRDLTKAEFADLLEFISAWGNEHSVQFRDVAPQLEPDR